MKILVVDDEPMLVKGIRFNLQSEGYEVITGSDGLEALQLVQEKNPDLVILDVMMPNMDGMTACSKIRESSNVPIILLTAKTDDMDKLMGFDHGADDYITKPFSMRELLARVKANIRRRSLDAGTKGVNENALKLGDVSIDRASMTVTKGGQPVEVTQKEYDLLVCLLSEPGKVYSREELMEKVWNYDYFGDVRTVDVRIANLRKKLGLGDAIRTISKAGYRLEERR